MRPDNEPRRLGQIDLRKLTVDRDRLRHEIAALDHEYQRDSFLAALAALPPGDTSAALRRLYVGHSAPGRLAGTLQAPSEVDLLASERELETKRADLAAVEKLISSS